MDQEAKEKKAAVRKDLSQYRSLEAVERSPGGQLLLKSLRRDAVDAIDTLISTFLTAPEHELRAQCAVLRERILMVRAITRAKAQKKFALKELEELSTDEIDEDEESGTV